MNPTDLSNKTQQEPSLPTLPNLGLTIAPQDDLIALPQDQTTTTTKPDQSVQTTPETQAVQATQETQVTLAAPEVRENSDPNFSVPSGWGAVTQTPKIEILEYPEPDNHNQNTIKDSGLVRFVKIFLIAVALILLGVLLGVLASSLLGGGTPNNAQTPQPTKTIDNNSIPAPSVASQSSQTDNQTEPEYSKKIEYRNNAAGPYSFDFLLTDDWKIATKSADKNNIDIKITNEDLLVSLFYSPTSKTSKSEICLQSEEISSKNIPYIKYNQYKDLQIGDLSWRLVKNSQATQSASYLICEQNNNNQFVSLTSIGFITSRKDDGAEINTSEENKIVNLFKGLKVIVSTISATPKK